MAAAIQTAGLSQRIAGPGPMPRDSCLMQATFQARPVLSPTTEQVLDQFGLLYGRAERKLFAAAAAVGLETKKVEAMKPAFCAKLGITARQFNALWRMLKGKISSKVEVDKLALAEVRAGLKAVRATLKKFDRQKDPLSSLQRKARLGKLRRLARLERKERELTNGKVMLCFGSRKLFRAQFALEANGFACFEEWQAAWRDARSNTFFLLGSKDETGGNQSCTATVADNGTLSLRIRLPDALIAEGAPSSSKYLLVDNVWFEHGHWELYAALDAGQALSYRFLRDAKGWRVFVSTAREDTRKAVSAQLGTVGVDINADHLAVSEADRFGNLINSFSVPCITQGKTSDQRKDAVRCAAKAVIAYCKKAGLPLVHEALDFTRRKQELTVADGARYARMLSSFAYGSILQSLQSCALLQDVPTVAVNPAYTSVVGRVKYAKRLGVSIHQAAALVIARRGMGYGERLPVRPEVPDGQNDHFVLVLPVRNRAKHEWSDWAKVRSQLSETLAGWHRLRKLAALEAGQAAQAAQNASRGQSDAAAVRSRPSNRQHNRSAGVHAKAPTLAG